jgi:hypothetical protein
MNPYKKPELKRLNPEDVPEEVKAEFEAAIEQAKEVSAAEPEELIAGKFKPTFDIRVFSTVIRELMIYRLNQMGLVNTQEHFWQAQQDAMTIRTELETAYKSSIQKAQTQKGYEFTELWMFGLLAYQRLTEDGLRLKDFFEMPKARMERQAAELGAALKAKAEKEGESVYMIKKKSREK